MRNSFLAFASVLAYASLAAAQAKITLRENWVDPIVVGSARKRRRAVGRRLHAARMARRDRAHHGLQRAGEGGRLPRPVLRHEPALRARHQLSDRRQLLESADAGRQPVPQALVVPHGVQAARGVSRQDALAESRRHQFPRQRLAEREADRRLGQTRRRVAAVRIRRDRSAAKAGRRQRARHRDLSARARRPRDHVRRLEPDAARQGHGPVARGFDHRHRTGRDPLSGRHHAPRRPGRAAFGARRADQRVRRAGGRRAERAGSRRRSSPRR